MKKQQSRPKQPDNRIGDIEHKLLDVARVARVTAGGRRFSFRVVVVVGDRSGKVGVGTEKGSDVQIAVEKAVRSAKKNMVEVYITKEGSIPHELYGKSSSAKVFLRPAKEGKGIIAGGSVRAVCDLAGYKNIVGKIISRSVNKLNNARAAVDALQSIRVVKKEDKESEASYTLKTKEQENKRL